MNSSLLDGVNRAFERLFCTPPLPEAVDVKAVTRSVTRYALQIGCDHSNAAAALSWALKNGAHTLDAVRKGNQRARQLYRRQRDAAPAPERA